MFPPAVLIKCTGGPIILSVDISENGPKFKGSISYASIWLSNFTLCKYWQKNKTFFLFFIPLIELLKLMLLAVDIGCEVVLINSSKSSVKTLVSFLKN